MHKIIAIFIVSVLTANRVYADLITTNTANACTDDFLLPKNNTSRLYATFAPNSYTCSAGTYLPANTDGCTTCLSGHTCGGGTYNFNETTDQGITFTIPITTNVQEGCVNDLLVPKNNTSRLYAIFEPKINTCAAGYYLPANAESCTKCPANNYCPGGIYTFNETVPQGITACVAGLYAPAGMWDTTQCGHILHIGENVVYLRSVKKTTPSLNVKIGNDIFYGNMTTTDVSMNADTTHKLKLNYGGLTYSVYDDSINPNE